MSYDPILASVAIDNRLWTYQDTVDYLLDFLGASTGTADLRDARRAAHEALRELCQFHLWSFFYTDGLVIGSAPYSTGTIGYDHTGGTYERQLTLTSGTLPTWAATSRLVVSGKEYQVSRRISATVAVLDSENNPGEDIAAGTTYELYRTCYPTPDLFVSMMSSMLEETTKIGVQYVHPRDWRFTNTVYGTSSQPCHFTIMGPREGSAYGRPQFLFSPPLDAARQYTFIYYRRSRPLVVQEYKTGTVTVSAGAATVTGSGTTFDSTHVGSVVRLSSNTTAPTGIYGANPYVEERVITDFSSTTLVTVDANWNTSRSGVAYSISSPVDIDVGTMLSAYLKLAEKLIGWSRRADDRPLLESNAHSALMEAKGNDSRYSGPRYAGSSPGIDWIDARLGHPSSYSADVG